MAGHEYNDEYITKEYYIGNIQKFSKEIKNVLCYQKYKQNMTQKR